VLVTHDDRTLPPGCRPWNVAALVTTFLDGINRGNQKQVAELFEISDRPDPLSGTLGWSWYSFNQGVSGATDEFVAYDEAKILSYLAARHERHERMGLLTIDVGRRFGSGRYVVFAAHVTRGADDLGSGRRVHRFANVKGVIDCERPEINRWVMASESRPGPGECPTVPGWKPGDAAIACARK
jgi:hypothetical protein